MLANLTIKNFRVLQDFRIDKLGHVNLIVGKNNCGKSSVLEALRIYALRGNPGILTQIAASHDESAAFALHGDDAHEGVACAPFSDFFYGRDFPANDADGAIHIGNQAGTQFIDISHSYFLDEDEILEPSPDRKLLKKTRRQVPKNALANETTFPEQALTVSLHETSHVGWIPFRTNPDPIKRSNDLDFWARLSKEIPLGYVPTQLASMDALASLWDKLAATSAEASMNAAMQIIDPTFQALRFVKPVANRDRVGSAFDLNNSSIAPRERRTAVVQLSSAEKRLPLRSMGEGMQRVLQLILEMVSAKGGMLLIDEFENGLHWSVQEKIWEMIFQLAHELDIQVFATTHSDDAIRAFAKVANADTQLDAILLRLVRKANPDRTIGISYDKEMLATATLTETEVR